MHNSRTVPTANAKSLTCLRVTLLSSCKINCQVYFLPFPEGCHLSSAHVGIWDNRGVWLSKEQDGRCWQIPKCHCSVCSLNLWICLLPSSEKQTCCFSSCLDRSLLLAWTTHSGPCRLHDSICCFEPSPLPAFLGEEVQDQAGTGSRCLALVFFPLSHPSVGRAFSQAWISLGFALWA